MSDLILEKQPKSPISEAYRTIRTNIDFSSIDKEIRTILVTSSGPAEGKTTTASNIAMAYAQAGKKTLLIDCDLRKPRIHKIFKISNRIGFTNMMADDMKLSEAAFVFSDTLQVLTAGIIPPNPSEILSSNKMKTFLQAASMVYERIIIDSPPINAVTDAQILGSVADGTVLVVSSDITNIEGAVRAKELLLKVKANILGVILRRVNVSRGKYGYGSYYYYYYAEDGEKKRRKKKNDRRPLSHSSQD
ncbi:MAG: CpsD/CapB family tyrosine-protein kinase [Bacillota bacterium]|nr:CpsD/CapB family tyrosine-protein kinase [Bacillota bacterium]